MPKDTANDHDFDQGTLEFAGESVHARQLQVGATKVAMGDLLIIPRHDTFAAIIRAKITDLGVGDVGGVPTLLHKAVATQAVLVDEQTAADVLDASLEQQSGQLRLLSLEGEARQAGRKAGDRSTDLGLWEYGPDDPLPELGGLIAMAAAALDEAGALDADAFDDPGAYLVELADLAEAAAAHALVPLLHARAMLARHQEQLERQLSAERARHAKADEDGNVPTPGEVDGDEALDEQVRASADEEGAADA